MFHKDIFTFESGSRNEGILYIKKNNNNNINNDKPGNEIKVKKWFLLKSTSAIQR